MIPKKIHQTWKTKKLPWFMRSFARTWKKKNPGFEYHLYDDAECLEFVKTKYPEYMAAYEALPHPVERADFFRYLIVYDQGGAYGDLDTVCAQPLEKLMLPGRECIVGIEAETDEAYAKPNQFFYPVQYCQWVFLAAPKHPFLKAVCDEVNRLAFDQSLSTLERTGPWVWTKVLNDYKDMPGVTILPISAFGAYQPCLKGCRHPKKDVYVVHYFFGSWSGGHKNFRNHLWLRRLSRAFHIVQKKLSRLFGGKS